MANRVNPEKPAHKTAAELKKLEEIKNKVAEYERNPPFDKSKLYMRYIFLFSRLHHVAIHWD